MKWINHLIVSGSLMSIYSLPLLPLSALGGIAPDFLERVFKTRHREQTHYASAWLIAVIISFFIDPTKISFAFFFGGLVHVFTDALTISGVPFSPMSSHRFHLLGGRLRTGDTGEYILSAVVLIVCAFIYVQTHSKGEFRPYFFNYKALYEAGIIDASEWKANRYRFF